ncbi:MAG: hypothetical protein AAF514_03875 [Verrucomicrobiota bacterium]
MRELPKGALAVRSDAGNTIPFVLITSSDGTSGLEGVSYATMKGGMRQTVSQVRRRMADKDVSGSGAGKEEKTTATSGSDDSDHLAKSQAWTNADGKTITAAVLAVDENNVEFLLENGKTVKYPVYKLSKESQTRLAVLRDDS